MVIDRERRQIAPNSSAESPIATLSLGVVHHPALGCEVVVAGFSQLTKRPIMVSCRRRMANLWFIHDRLMLSNGELMANDG